MKKIYALIPSERDKECTDHIFRFMGAIPCTGLKRCVLCGATVDETETLKAGYDVSP